MVSTNSLASSWTAATMGRVAAPLREQVISALRDAILTFQLKPGQRLVERELIEQLGVSRTTVREALRELASEGLVTVVPQHGAMVSAPSLDEIRDLYDVRAALESLVVRRFIERASDEDIDRLRTSVDEFAADPSEGIMRLLFAKDGFYFELIRGAQSAAFQQLLDTVQARVRAMRSTSGAEPGRAQVVVAELRLIVDAIAARDAALAEKLIMEHVHSAAETSLRALREEGLV